MRSSAVHRATVGASSFGTAMHGRPAKSVGSTVPIKLQLCDADKVNVSRADVAVTAVDVRLFSPDSPGIQHALDPIGRTLHVLDDVAIKRYAA